MHAAVLKAVRVSAHVRSHVICLKCPKRLIALVFDDVDLPYCTSKVGLAESNGRLLLGIWRDSLHVTCGLTACTPR